MLLILAPFSLASAPVFSYHLNMLKRSRSGRILHGRRPFCAGRPMHLTTHVVDGAPSLRQPEVRRHFEELLEGARQRGVRTVSFSLLDTHVHWVVLAESAKALWDATRYLFGLLVRRLNRMWGRRGKLLAERYWSVCCKTAKQAFHALAYVLRNAADAGHWVKARCLDRYTDVDEDLLGQNRFLRSVLGYTPAVRRALLLDMSWRRVVFTPLSQRLQMSLPGLA